MKINNSRGDLTDMSAEKKTLPGILPRQMDLIVILTASIVVGGQPFVVVDGVKAL